MPAPRSELAHSIETCLERRWLVHLRCEGCAREVTWGADRLKGFPRGLTIAAVANAAECTACGHVGADGWLTQDNASGGHGNPIAPVLGR